METKDNVTTYRSHRVGSVTAVFLLITMTFFTIGMAVVDECFQWAELQMWRYY